MKTFRLPPLAAWIACGLLVGTMPEGTLATSIINAGPFTLTFYQNGETDGTATGAQDWTSEQIADVVASVQVWSSTITDVPGRQIDMHCFWNNFSGSILGGSSSNFTGNYSRAWTFSEYVWREGQNYARPGGYAWDTRITYDTDAAGYAWNFGSDAPLVNQIDFRSVVTHEIGHSLGFIGTYNSSADTWWLGGVTAWDSNLRDDAGNAPTPGGTGTPGNFNQVDNPVWFTGSNAVAVNGGPVPVYAPTTYASGSSLSHVNYSTYPNALMSPFIGLGQMGRSPTDLEWAIMQDLGWTLVPEPGTTALLACGMLAACLSRRRTRVC